MIWLQEALDSLKSLTEADESAIYLDKDTGKKYTVKNGKFVLYGNNDQLSQQNGQAGGKSNNAKTQEPSSGPAIGDKGNQDIQELEDTLRELDAVKDALGELENEDYDDESGDDINDLSDEIQQSSDDLKQKIDELKKELEKKKKELEDKGGSLNPYEQKDLQDKADHIKEIFDDVQVSDNLMQETERKVSQSRKEKRRGEKEAKEKEKWASMSDAEVINMLKQSLNQTLRAEIHENEEETWSKINKKAYGAGLLKKGTKISEKVDIPSINVYFDRSGSWGPEKSKFGYEAVQSIMYLQKKGLLKINLYYFNDDIMDSDPGYGRGGTRGTPILEHIKLTKPQNVLIMTDSDISDCDSTVIVPGAVWLLFKGAISKNLQEHIKGKKLTKTFFIK